MNPLIQMFMQMFNPQKMVIQMMNSNPNMKNNPMVSNLIGMAEKGDAKGIEQFARNFCKENGKDFDKEFNAFLNGHVKK